MTQPDDEGRLQDMLETAREVVTIVQARTRADLSSDRILELALVRLLEIIGEAAARLSTDFRRRHGQVPWPDIIGLRNRLIHEYSDVDLDIVWSIAENDMPTLVRDLERILVREGKGT